MSPATHNTWERKPGHGGDKYPAFPPDVLWVAFSTPPGSLSLVKSPVLILIKENYTKMMLSVVQINHNRDALSLKGCKSD
jgi:hypothetical protein